MTKRFAGSEFGARSKGRMRTHCARLPRKLRSSSWTNQSFESPGETAPQATESVPVPLRRKQACAHNKEGK
jgi:hypothetical protein